MAPEHNEVLAKLQFIQKYVETIIEVARCKAAPLNLISETMTPRTSTALGNVEPNSTTYRRLQQLLLYMRCLHLLSQCLEFARSELKSKRLKPSTTVKTGECQGYMPLLMVFSNLVTFQCWLHSTSVSVTASP